MVFEKHTYGPSSSSNWSKYNEHGEGNILGLVVIPVN